MAPEEQLGERLSSDPLNPLIVDRQAGPSATWRSYR